MVFSAGGLTTIEGQLTYANASLTLNSSSALGIFSLADTGSLDGNQNLILSGAGAKSFAGSLGSLTPIGTGSGYAITMSGGDVTFGNLTTASGLYASSKVIFTGAATLAAGNQGSELLGNTEFSEAIMNSAGNVVLGDSAADQIVVRPGVSILTGTGSYTLNGTVNGSGRLILEGSGTKSFENGLSMEDLTQADGSGVVTLKGAINLTGDADLRGSLVLGGAAFSVNGAATLGNATADAISLNTGTVTFGGAGTYTINGKVTGQQTIALSGAGTKTFASTADLAGFTQADGSGRAVFQGNVTTTSDSTFASLVTLKGITFSTVAGGTSRFGTAADDILSLSGARVTLNGGGAYLIGGAVSGSQSVLALSGAGNKTFASTVGALGFDQASSAAVVEFQGDVATSGNSIFNGQVVLGANFNTTGSNSQNTFNLLDLSQAVTLGGAGAYTVNGAVGGGNNLTLAGGGLKTFQSSVSVGAFEQAGGQVRLGGDVTAGGAVDLASVATLRDVVLTTTGLDKSQTYGTVSLGGNFTAQAGAGSVAYTTVTGSGNLNTTADALVLNGIIQNRGSFTATRSGNILLGDDPGAFLSDLNGIQSTGTIGFTADGGSILASGITTANSLTLSAVGPGQIIAVSSVNTQKTLTLNAADGEVIFDPDFPSRAGTLSFTAGTVENLQDGIVTGGFGAISLSEEMVEPMTLSSSGNLVLSGAIQVPGTIYLEAAGTVVNTTGGNPFAPETTVIINSPSLFSSSLQGPFIPNARYVMGTPPAVSGMGMRTMAATAQAGSVTVYFQNTDNFQPYSSEFTTGTGQPYILATQQNAVPAVVMPTAITVAGAFPARVSYSAEELEMMTPEERSAYEAAQRQQSARVILERQPGQADAGGSLEEEAPQANVPAGQTPGPTARSTPDGKPLANKPARENHDSTQILRLRPAKAVVLRPETDGQEVLENERLAAEVNMGSAPVAGR